MMGGYCGQTLTCHGHQTSAQAILIDCQLGQGILRGQALMFYGYLLSLRCLLIY